MKKRVAERHNERKKEAQRQNGKERNRGTK